MRGFPPLHLLFFVLALAALAMPLTRLTFGRVTATPLSGQLLPEDKEDSRTTRSFLRLRFSHPPLQLKISPLADAEAPALFSLSHEQQPVSPFETEVHLPIIDHSVELSITAEWGGDVSQAAVTVDVEPDGMEARSQTVWADGNALDEILTFVWKS